MTGSIRAISKFLHQGNRPAQEDFALGDAARGVFAVADGFGGPEAGCAASKSSAEAVREFLVKEAGDLDATLPFVLRSYFSLAGNVLFNALVHANRKLLVLNQEKGVHEKGGASLIAGFMDGDLLALASVGSCEAWLLRGSQAVKLVTPRLYGKLLDPFAEEKISEHRIPLMALGMNEDLEPEIWEYRVQPGDWLLLSSGSVGSFVQKDLLRKKAENQSSKKIEAAFPSWLEEGQRCDPVAGNLSCLLVLF